MNTVNFLRNPKEINIRERINEFDLKKESKEASNFN